MDLLSSTLGAVGQIGQGLDKFTGGRAMRGALAGKPRELLSVLPFSDSMGLTDEHDQTSGRDLTDRYGLTRKGDNDFGSNALGFGADMLANPLGLVGAGLAARAAPTAGKALIAGAKSLTGLDLLDHLSGLKNVGKGAAKSVGKFARDESGSLNPGAFTGRPPKPSRRSLLSPEEAVAKRKAIIDEHTNLAINEMGKGAGSLTNDQGRELVRRFIVPPSPDEVPGGGWAATDKFMGDMSRGRDAARAYVGAAFDATGYHGNPMYYDINNHLRQLGPEGASREIAAIRSGDASSLAAPFSESATGRTSVGDLDAPPYQSPLTAARLDRVRPNIEGLMSLLEHTRLPEDMHLYRGVNGDGTQLIESLLHANLDHPSAVGKEFTDPGFMSATYDPATAEEFMQAEQNFRMARPGVTFDFNEVPHGRKAALINAAQNEVLFPPGRKIRIDDNSNFPHIKATLFSAIMASLMGRHMGSMSAPPTGA